jgi:hypothetical protein
MILKEKASSFWKEAIGFSSRGLERDFGGQKLCAFIASLRAIGCFNFLLLKIPESFIISLYFSLCLVSLCPLD